MTVRSVPGVMVSVARSGRSLIAIVDANSLPSDTDLQAAAAQSLLRLIRYSIPHWSGLNKCAILLGTHRDGALLVRFVQDIPGGDWTDSRGNCGNALAAAAVYAHRAGIVRGDLVRLVAANTGQAIEVRISSEPAASQERVDIGFLNPAGAITGSLLPTGSTVDMLIVPGEGRVQVSMVDAGNPYVFVEAETLGLLALHIWTATDTLAARLEAIRCAAMDRLGIVGPSVFPKVAIVAPPAVGTTAAVAARMISVPSWHPAFALTGMVCLAVAACIPGTVVQRIAALQMDGLGRIVLHHPGGQSIIDVHLSGQDVERVWVQQSVELLGEWRCQLQ